MFCTECGTGNPDRATFCLSCGAALSGEASGGSANSGASTEIGSVAEIPGTQDDPTPAVPNYMDGDHPAVPVDESVDVSVASIPPSETEDSGVSDTAPSLWRRVIGWALIALGIGVAVISVIGLAGAQGGFSTAVSNVMGGESASSNGGDDLVSAEDAVFAPNVIGLPRATALSRIEDVGVDSSSVAVTLRPSAVASDVVMDQVPRPGEVVTGSMELVVADPIVVMPDVVGLDADIAAVRVAEAGIDPNSISLTEQPFATIPNLVLEQTPRAGSDSPTTVILTVASLALAPDVVGLSADAALDALNEIGAEATLTAIGVLDVDPQTVVGQSIPAGSAVVGPIELSVAKEPASTALVDLESEDSENCYTKTVAVGDTNYPDTLYCTGREGRDGWISYRLNRGFSRLRLALARIDNSSASGAIVEIRSDGALVESVTLVKSAYPAVDVQVGNTSVIEIRVRGDSVSAALVGARVYEPTQPVP